MYTLQDRLPGWINFITLARIGGPCAFRWIDWPPPWPFARRHLSQGKYAHQQEFLFPAAVVAQKDLASMSGDASSRRESKRDLR